MSRKDRLKLKTNYSLEKIDNQKVKSLKSYTSLYLFFYSTLKNQNDYELRKSDYERKKSDYERTKNDYEHRKSDYEQRENYSDISLPT